MNDEPAVYDLSPAGRVLVLLAVISATTIYSSSILISSALLPTTTQSRSLTGMPSNSSRTAPPTT